MEASDKTWTSLDLDRANIVRSKRLFGWAAWICGVIVVVSPIVGLVGTVIGMMGAFAELAKTGSADPSALAGDISVALLTTFWGLFASALALIPFIVFLVLFLKQRKALRRVV